MATGPQTRRAVEACPDIHDLPTMVVNHLINGNVVAGNGVHTKQLPHRKKSGGSTLQKNLVMHSRSSSVYRSETYSHGVNIEAAGVASALSQPRIRVGVAISSVKGHAKSMWPPEN